MAKVNEQLSGLLQQHIEAGEFPSAVYLVGKRDEIVYEDALGHSVVEPYRVANKIDTIYDLASLTKPLVTALLCARRIELGELTLDSSVSHYLPEFDRTDKQMITIRELLTHTSGLPAWRPLYVLTEEQPDRAAGAIASLDLEYKPGTRVVYSDLGFIALGILLERMMHQRLADMAKREIFEPLNLQQTFFNPEIALQTGIAACETGNTYERDMSKQMGAGEYANSRQRLIWGEVHDGNAYFLGGAAGHAGLFSTARETFLGPLINAAAVKKYGGAVRLGKRQKNRILNGLVDKKIIHRFFTGHSQAAGIAGCNCMRTTEPCLHTRNGIGRESKRVDPLVSFSVPM